MVLRIIGALILAGAAWLAEYLLGGTVGPHRGPRQLSPRGNRATPDRSCLAALRVADAFINLLRGANTGKMIVRL